MIMSAKKKIIECHPDKYNKRETFAFTDYICPYCKGEKFFSEEIGRDKIQTTPCPYCEGAGVVMCKIVVSWLPQKSKSEST